MSALSIVSMKPPPRTIFAIDKARRIARGGGPLRDGERKVDAFGINRCDLAGAVGRTIAGFDRHGCAGFGSVSRHPTCAHRFERVRVEPRVFMPLYDPKRIGGKVLAGHKPRLSRALSAAAHADALALAERIKLRPTCSPTILPVSVRIGPGCVGR